MTTIGDLFPEKGKLVLTGSGRQVIERLGIDTARQVVLGVLQGENIRQQTEPLTRRRVALATGALVALFAKGWQEIDDFSGKLSELAVEQLSAKGPRGREVQWPAQWLIGLTGKGFQNVLRSDPEARRQYIRDFEEAIAEAAQRCENDYGRIEMTLGFVDGGNGVRKTLGWEDITRLTTAIGSATLTIRGSEKSAYGKLFERLVLGSVLSILGLKYIKAPSDHELSKVFWLSDNADERECDATVRLYPGKLARFDIGFIGQGNPEIMKDKLSRYARETEQYGIAHTSRTFIIVDRMSATGKTRALAERAGTEIVQMSMQFRPKELAQRIKARPGFESEILNIPDPELSRYLEDKIRFVPLSDFLNIDLSLDAVIDDSADETVEAE
jgi:hypothetical protein